MDNIVALLIQEALDKTIKEYGFEGAIEAIERVYTAMPQTKEIMLTALKQRLEK